MSSSAYSLILTLNTGIIWMNRLSAPVHICFGTFGNLFNIIIFTRRNLRTNPCSMYFLAGSIDNLCVIYTAFLARFLASGWNVDASASNNVLCKLRYFVAYPTANLVLWFVVLASIDRFLSSSKSARLRQLSSLSIARKSIVAMTIFMFLIHIHIFFFYYVTPLGCDFTSLQYALFFGFFYVLFGSFIPIILMAIFGILAIRNAYNTRRRIAGPQSDNQRAERIRSNDRQLLVMLLFQLLIFILFSVPYGITTIYIVTITYITSIRLSTNDYVILNFVYNLSRVLYYCNPVVGFYIYTLTGSKFRAEFKRCLKHGVRILIRCLPLSIQQIFLNENERGPNQQSLVGTRGIQTADSTQQQPVLLTSVE